MPFYEQRQYPITGYSYTLIQNEVVVTPWRAMEQRVPRLEWLPGAVWAE